MATQISPFTITLIWSSPEIDLDLYFTCNDFIEISYFNRDGDDNVCEAVMDFDSVRDEITMENISIYSPEEETEYYG